MKTPEQRAKAAAYIREWNRKHPESVKNSGLLRNFGITFRDYTDMWKAQKGVCAICGNPEVTPTNPNHVKRVRDLAVDHSHSTGKVRQLLCRGCNQGIGNFRENPGLLDKAAAYLRLHI